MILSASRRTDIPNYYSEWFYNRVKEGFAYVRNPMNIHKVSKIKISPDVIDCIVFWTKNPQPMIDRLQELKDYHYYFQFTLNSYGKDVEENIPRKATTVIETFQRLSDKIGRQKVIWRYDPILLTEKYTIDYHVNYFEKIASKIHNYTEKCTISFIDFYKSTANNMKNLEIKAMEIEDKRTLSSKLAEIAKYYNLLMDTCAEDIDLNNLDIAPAKCIDDKLIEKIIGCKIKAKKDKNQRLKCGCIMSIDIGMYNTCINGCKYCYGNYSMKSVYKNFKSHNKDFPLICSTLTQKDIVTDREIKSLKESQ